MVVLIVRKSENFFQHFRKNIEISSLFKNSRFGKIKRTKNFFRKL
jgi:hypothetical protein